MAEEKGKKTTLFVDLLKRDNEQIKEERADRIGSSVKEAQIRLLLEKKSEIRSLEDQLESMTDLSASNSSLDFNAVRDINADKFVKDYQSLLEKFEIAQRKYNLAVQTGIELHGIDIKILM